VRKCPAPPTCGASRRLELYYRPRPAVPLPAPAKPSSQLARAGAGACRCLPFPSPTYRVRPPSPSPPHRPFRNSSLTRFYFIYINNYTTTISGSLLVLSTVSLRRVAAAPVDNNRTLPATCAYVPIETGGNLPSRR